MKNVRVVWKLVAITFLGVIGVLAVGALGLAALRGNLLDERREMARRQVELGLHILVQFGQREAAGELTRDEAKRQAKESIRDLGYGKPEYFWIINHEPRMIMHPYLPDLEGMHIDEIADSDIASVFAAIVASADRNGSGFAEYDWRRPGSDELVRKVSYVATYEPWGWILGAGVYVDDVQKTFLNLALSMGGIAAAIAALVLGGSVWVGRSITVPLTHLAAVLRRLSEHDLAVEVPEVDRRDELGDLARATRAFHDSLVEREQLLAELAVRNRVLKESEERFRDLSELLPETVLELDEKGRITFANRTACRIFGWPEPFGSERHTVLEILDASEHERTLRNLGRILSGEDIGASQYLARRADGETFSVLARSSPVVREGRAVGLRAILFDISERIAAEQRENDLRNEIAHVARLSTMGEMAAGFAHELNQPLAAISNYAQGSLRRLDSGLTDPEVLRMPVEKMSKEAIRAAEIIRRIRDFVRKREPEKTVFRVDEAIADAAGLLGNEIRHGDIDFAMEIDDGLPPVLGDPVAIRQVLLNLIRNAVEVLDACEDGERGITVRAVRQGPGTVEIEVEDSGPGILAEIRRRIFEPFFTTKASGTGMGLPICRTIIEAHGGSLTVDVGERGGSLFRFQLPVDADSERTAA